MQNWVLSNKISRPSLTIYKITQLKPIKKLIELVKLK